MEIHQRNDCCLNCGNTLPAKENYCPECGQENKDQKVPIGVFLEELLASLFSFDGKFLQTLTAFFFKPGKLTIAFNSGQRKKYTHPIRLYLIFSLFYFFMIGFLIPKDMFDRILNSDLGLIFTEFRENGEEKLLEPDQQKEVRLQLEDEIREEMPAEYSISTSNTSDSVNKTHSWKELRFLSIDPTVNEEQFSQALANSPYSFGLDLTMEKKRAFIAHSNLFVSQVAKNLPLMMLILLPVFALFVHVLFWKREVYFIENLILGFHLHAFAYALYGIVILLSFFGGFQSSWLMIGAFVLVTTYAYIALIKIYRQHWFKTLIKFWILGGFYLLVLSMGVAVDLYLSLILL
ncbi:DUF3667 domain-containing protein [Lunatibacter salilacus]|uniref:DUF3667 domain-containing protein n=1 Tax=Lunatibacter salilacus TaxID=2483804 RepID=UPI00131D449E|nr:DUF3667 domain-containing protein [Lunatibacter salilacus]